MENTLVWANFIDSKDLIANFTAKYDLRNKHYGEIMDVASGACESLVALFPFAKVYHFLDNFKLPSSKPNYVLHKQSVSEKIDLPSESLDLVMTNGSYDHFHQEDRITSFLEVERCLKPGGLFVFACEYFDYDPKCPPFSYISTDPLCLSMNCPAFDNINLRDILGHLTTLKICQENLDQVPDGRPLRLISGFQPGWITNGNPIPSGINIS